MAVGLSHADGKCSRTSDVLLLAVTGHGVWNGAHGQ